MITSKHISELLNFKAPTPAIVSLYLEVDDGRDYVNAMRQLAKEVVHESGFSIHEEDLRRIQTYVETEFEPAGSRGLAVFSCKRFGLWRACPLPQPVKNKLRIDERPYLAPLLSMTDQHHRFGVLLASPGQARFLEVFMGQITEYQELALSAAGTEQQHDFLKTVTERLEGLARNQGFQRIVVGVSPSLSLPLVNHLHSSMQHNLILDADMEPELAASAVLDRITACEDQARQVRETVLVHRLIDAARGSSRMGVVGLEGTLEALQKSQVRMLLVRDGYAKMGRCCPQCGRLSLNWPKCAECGRATGIVFNLVAEMVDRALAANCEVVRLFHDTPLDNLGKIGAELTCNPPETARPVAAVKAKRARILA
jgi:peptide subunit release factor 1 (eRF1)